MSYQSERNLRKLGLAPKLEFKKKPTPLKKVSDKRAIEIANSKVGGDSQLDLWFDKKRKECTGKCFLCGGKSEKLNDETYRRSIHHLLDKRKTMFPSVALHEDNWLEVCFYGNCCHTQIHNGKITFELLRDSKEWDVIKEKLINILPFADEKERKNKLYDKLINLVYPQPTLHNTKPAI